MATSLLRSRLIYLINVFKEKNVMFLIKNNFLTFCLNSKVRQAAQSLLMAELRRLGPKGRKTLVDYWAQFLPVSEIEGASFKHPVSCQVKFKKM